MDVSIATGEDMSMLVLSRKEQQRIIIGDSIVVTVVRICGDKVRLGIEAPNAVRVDREEIRAMRQRQLPGGSACLRIA